MDDNNSVLFQVEELEKHDIKLPRFTTPLKIMAITVALALIIGFFIFLFGRSHFDDNSVSFNIDGPEKIAAGEQMTYVVKCKNENDMPINNVKMTFYYPQDVVVLREGIVIKETQETIDIGSIPEKSECEKTFQIIMVGHNGAIKTARAVLYFIPGGLTTELQKTAELNTTINKLPINLVIVAPQTITNGQQVNYIIDYRNQTQDEFRNLLLQVKFPEDFTITSAKPSIDTKKSPSNPYDIWEIPILNGGDEGRISISGVIRGAEKEVKTITVVLRKEATTPTSRFPVDFEKVEASSVVSMPYVSAKVAVHGAQDFVAHVGETLDYDILVSNNTDSDLTAFVLTAKLDGAMFDLSSVRTTGSFDSRDGTLLWNSAVVPELGLLKAHQSMQVSFSVDVKNNFPSFGDSEISKLNVEVFVETFDVPSSFHLESISASDEVTTKISTLPAFSQQLILQDSVFGPANPYPPKVDNKTVFTIRWKIENSANDLMPAKISAVIPPGIAWENSYRVVGSQAAPYFDPKTSILTWNLGGLPSGVGGPDIPAYELYFQVSITPSVNQVGSSPALLKKARFEGIDSVTNENFLINATDINTSSGTGFGSGSIIQ